MIYTELIGIKDAYKKLEKEILEGNVTPDKKVVHIHEGSIGDLCLKEISENFESALNEGK